MPSCPKSFSPVANTRPPSEENGRSESLGIIYITMSERRKQVGWGERTGEEEGVGAAAGERGRRVGGAREEEGARRGAPPRLQRPQPQPPVVPVPPQRRHPTPRQITRIGPHRRRVGREPSRPRPPPRPPHRRSALELWSGRVARGVG